jgi:hypothetical protein
VTTARVGPPAVRCANAGAPARSARSGTTVAVCAHTAAMRRPVTNSMRSHQCEPMSANVRDAPLRAGSTRQLSSSEVESQSCR